MDSLLYRINRIEAKNCHQGALELGPCHKHEGRPSSPEQDLFQLWHNIKTHYFPGKEQSSALLSRLSHQNEAQLEFPPSLFSLLLEPFDQSDEKKQPFVGFHSISAISDTLSPEYLEGMELPDRALLLLLISAAHLRAELAAKGRITSSASTKFELRMGRVLSSSKADPAKKRQSLFSMVHQLNQLNSHSNTQRKANRDQFQQQIQAQQLRLARLQKTNSRKLSAVSLHLKHLRTAVSTSEKGFFIKYYKNIIQLIQQKQYADSISHFQQLKPRGKTFTTLIHFQAAMQLPPRKMTMQELVKIDRLRQFSLFKYYNVGQKSRFALMSSYQPAIQSILNNCGPEIKMQDCVLDVKAVKPDSRRAKKNTANMCHQCRNLFSSGFLLQCCLGGPKSCGRFYCAGCLKMFDCRFQDKCPYCQENCYCTRCQRSSLIVRLKQIIQQLSSEDSMQGSSQTADNCNPSGKRILRHASKHEEIEPPRRKLARRI